MTTDSLRYERLECIGRGSYGDVFRGVDKASGQQVAIKVIDLEDVEDDIEDIHKEISTLAGCRSKNITEYFGSVLQPGSTELLIIMELLSCSVADLLHLAPLDEATIAYVLHEVLQALAYLHSEHRIHRDIKAANILLSTTGEVKISDFGVSGQLTGTLGYRRRTFVGTPFWMAPEVIESSEEGYSEKADIWSVGITAIEMAVGSPPHADLHPMRVLFLIPKNPPPQLEGKFTDVFKDFVSLCLQKDAASRPSAKELLAHRFLASAQPPEGLGDMIAEYAKRRRPLTSRRDLAEDYSATLPGWDFGTKKGRGITVKLGDTMRTAAADRYVQFGKVDTIGRTSRTALTGTLRTRSPLSLSQDGTAAVHVDIQQSHRTTHSYGGSTPSTSDGGMLAPGGRPPMLPGTMSSSEAARSRLELSKVGMTNGTAAGPGPGSAPLTHTYGRSSSQKIGALDSSAPGTSLYGRPPPQPNPWPPPPHSTGSIASTTDSNAVTSHYPPAKAASFASPAPATVGPTVDDPYGTTRISSSLTQLNNRYATVQSRSTLPSPGLAAHYSTFEVAANGTHPAHAANSNAGVTITKSKVSMQGHSAGLAMKQKLQQLQIDNPATASPTKEHGAGSGSAWSSQEAAAAPAAAESGAALTQVLLPSLHGLPAMSDKAAAHLLSSVQTQLASLERMMPGTSAQLLQEIIVKLSVSSDPSLQGAKAAAASLLAGAGQQGDQQQRRVLPNLGPLGEYLLGRWQEEVAQEQALLARAQKLKL